MSDLINQMGQGQQILGSIIAWELNGIKIGYNQLINAMDNAGLDSGIVRTKTPSQVFMQAAKTVSEEYVIDKLGEDTSDIRFQFTKRYRENGEFEYVREAIMVMSKYTGRIFCADDPDLAAQAEAAVDAALDQYTGANISKYIRQLMKENADIFSVNDGVYLVPSAFNDFLDQLGTFFAEIGGRFNRFPIAKGTEYGDKAFRETISGQIERTIEAHVKAVEELTPDNQARSFEARAKDINDTRYKVEVYAAYLGSEAARLLQVVAEAKKALRAKIMEASKNVVVED